MHLVQQHILVQLSKNDFCRYRDIKPKEVDGNLFMYHLRQVISGGLVQKSDSHYSLTSNGIRYSSQLSLKTFQPRLQPKIVTLIASQNADEEWLLYRSKRQPFSDKIGFPYGKIHLGEKIREAADRELAEKAGVTADLRHVGDAYIIVHRDQELISQILFHVFRGTNVKIMKKIESEVWQCYWDTVRPIQENEYMPGFLEIYHQVKKPSQNRFFKELSLNLPKS
jgi:ADP-ribose pyrophosphatase YjhB (NUDIX family)